MTDSRIFNCRAISRDAGLTWKMPGGCISAGTRWISHKLMRIPFPLVFLLQAGCALAGGPMICLNDQTVTYASNAMVFRDDPAPGSATFLDLETFPPSARTLEGVPSSVIGPPTTVALVPGTNRAIAVSSMRSQKADGKWSHVPVKTISLLAFDQGAAPRVAGQIEAGLQPSGLSIAPNGKTALIPNRAEGTLSVLAVDSSSLRELQRIKVCEPADSMAHVEISPDGLHAVATLNEARAVLLLGLAGTPKVLQRIEHGKKPYAARFLPDGKSFAVADIGLDAVTIYKLTGDQAEAIADVPVGRIPEGLDVSPDGKWIAASCMEGANLTDKDHPKFGQPAKVFLIGKEKDAFKVAKVLEVEGGPQFAVFSANGDYLVVSNTRLKQLAFYKTDGGKFTDTGYRLPVDGEPVAIAR